MSEGTKIEWATHTFNPWTGCFPVSPGCLHCYMMALLKRFGKDGRKRTRTSESYWKQAARWNREASKFAEAALGYGTSVAMHDAARQRVFPSLCDWLDDEVPIEWLADFLKLIHDTPNLDWLLLTKRPENFFTRMAAVVSHNNKKPFTGDLKADWDHVSPWTAGRNIPRNVWIGASVEDQKRADERIPELLKIPAAVRFLSVEPLLGPVDLHIDEVHGWCPSEQCDCFLLNKTCRNCGEPAHSMIDWVIVGGESGPGARPCNVDWVRDIVRQCKAAGVPCFVKQLGSNPIMEPGPITWPCEHPKGGKPDEWPEDLRVREFPND